MPYFGLDCFVNPWEVFLHQEVYFFISLIYLISSVVSYQKANCHDTMIEIKFQWIVSKYCGKKTQATTKVILKKPRISVHYNYLVNCIGYLCMPTNCMLTNVRIFDVPSQGICTMVCSKLFNSCLDTGIRWFKEYVHQVYVAV